VFAGIGQLPVGHALHDAEDGLRRDVGGICLCAQFKTGGKKNRGDKCELARKKGFHAGKIAAKSQFKQLKILFAIDRIRLKLKLHHHV
jgi:hypothetical protein